MPDALGKISASYICPLKKFTSDDDERDCE